MIILDGALAGDELYILDVKNGEDEATWNIIPVTGKTPGKRYGHTMCFMKPYVVVFGGNTGSKPANDVWVISLETNVFTWKRLEIPDSPSPSPRLYHASGVCLKGNAQGMMIVYGGRDANENPLNDTWGLRRHRNQTWDWVAAPYKSGEPKHRYNVLYLKLNAAFINICFNFYDYYGRKRCLYPRSNPNRSL